jgi:uncharacterized protein
MSMTVTPPATAAAAPIPVCIFVKPPAAGAVKTRLTPSVSPRRAARLAGAFFVDTLRTVTALGWARPVVATAGAADDAEARHRLDALVCGTSEPVAAWPQGEGDLGARLERVLRRALGGEVPGAIAVGTDAPGLPRALLDAARAALADHDAVLGPCDDGGYYLMGLRRCPEGLLEGLPWSTETTFEATRARLEARGLSVAILPGWFDVDRPADLSRLEDLLARGAIRAPATARVLAEDGPAISVVMPVLNEAARIGGALGSVVALDGFHEVVVADGGSDDGTAATVRATATRHPGLRLVTAPRGRARQMNAGAAIATGDVLLFLHADTRLPEAAAAHIRSALADPAAVAGAFKTWTVHEGDRRRWLAPMLHLADVRSRYTGLPYGDQAIFVRTEVFRALGGFPDQPLMEDLELARRLRRRGRIVRANARVAVSGRRFVERPIFYAACVNVFPLLYRIGVSAEHLARIYRHVR